MGIPEFFRVLTAPAIAVGSRGVRYCYPIFATKVGSAFGMPFRGHSVTTVLRNL